MNPKMTNYKFSVETKRYYYQEYFNYKTLEEEDNVLILLELLLIDKKIIDLIDNINTECNQLFDMEKNLNKFFIFFYVYLIDIIKKYKSFYFLIFDEPCTKKKLWNDLEYKLKFVKDFKHLEFNFTNPYKDSNKFVF